MARMPGMPEPTYTVRTSREEALAVFCPDCGSRPGVECVRASGEGRKAQHAGRHAEAVLGGAKPVLTREEWAARQREGAAVARAGRGRYSNLRRDRW